MIARDKINYIVVNYHYVEDPSPEFSGVYPCAVGEFEKQIEFLSKRYSIVSIDEVFNAAKSMHNGNYCAITLDDGLRDQYENTLPILKKYSARATFFPITSTLDGYVPPAHKTHAILSRISADKLIESYNSFLRGEFSQYYENYFIPKDRRVSSTRRLHEDVLIANFKETIRVIPEIVKNSFLDTCFNTLGLNEKEISSDLFITEDEIRAIMNGGHFIGSHAHRHYSLDSMHFDSAKSDIIKSQGILSGILGMKPTIISYPHGRYTKELWEVLKEVGISFGVTTDQRGVDVSDHALAIPRLDTNDIKNLMI